MQSASSNGVKVFTNIGCLLTLEGAAKKQGRRITESDLSEIHDAVLVCREGRVLWSGPKSSYRPNEVLKDCDEGCKVEIISLAGLTVLPGFVEPHTHGVFAGNRAQEFEWRMAGQTYQEISVKGGGILSTVSATRQASFDELQSLAQRRVAHFLEQGVSTLEVKSGYGLDLETEVKCLKVIRSLVGPRIVATYLGAHSRSPDHPDLQSYMEFMLSQVLPKIVSEHLADRVDIYVEKEFYDLNLARQYLDKARELNLPITAHVEQLSDSGGTRLVLEYGPQSVDHVVYLSEADIKRVAQSSSTAVLLPASDFYLKMCYPSARSLIDQGARVALSTDFNPGTSPTQDLSLIGVLARLEMKMSLAEVLSAFTLGGAHALGLADLAGSLTVGKQCDFAVLNGSWRELFYSVGHHPVVATYRSGNAIWVAYNFR